MKKALAYILGNLYIFYLELIENKVVIFIIDLVEFIATLCVFIFIYPYLTLKRWVRSCKRSKMRNRHEYDKRDEIW